MSGGPTCGIVYIAFGETYRAEASRSIASVRRHSPGLPAAVIGDVAFEGEPQPDFFVQRPLNLTYGSKMEYLFEGTPFDRTLFLDTDTVLARDVTPIFDLLDGYEFGLRFSGPECDEGLAPRFHPYAHSAALLFSRTPGAREIFAEWKRSYDEALAIYRGGSPHGPSGDRLLAPVIAKSAARVVSLPSHVLWNAVEPEVLFSPPVICHGRLPRSEQHAAVLDAVWRGRKACEPLQRVWLPNIRGLLPSGLRRSDPFLAVSLVLQRMVNAWRVRKRGAR